MARPAVLALTLRLVRSHSPGKHAHQGGADGGQIAQQSFGIAHVVIGRIEIEVIGKDVAIDPGGQVLGHVHERNIAAGHAHPGNRNPADQHPVAHQRSHQRRRLGPGAAVIEIEKAAHEIADRQALQHPEEPHMRQVKEREAVHEDAEEDQDDRRAAPCESPVRGAWLRAPGAH